MLKVVQVSRKVITVMDEVSEGTWDVTLLMFLYEKFMHKP